MALFNEATLCFEQAMRALPEDWAEQALQQQEGKRFTVFINDYAQLLQATNRLEETEPLMRRVIAIILVFQQKTRHPHPHLNSAIQNYLQLLQAMK